jgi:hypothetical protein
MEEEHWAGLLTIAQNKNATTNAASDKIYWIVVSSAFFYFVRWLRLSSASGLEKARSATPISKQSATAANMIGTVSELLVFGR